MKISVLVLILMVFAVGCNRGGVKAKVDGDDPLLSTSSETGSGKDTSSASDAIPTDSGTGIINGSDSVVAVCGNGVLEKGELCDDLNVADSDGCSADCTVWDEDYDCSRPGEQCVRVSFCGNGILEGSELCDEGEGNKTAGCSAACDAVTTGWVCPRPNRSCVPLPVCGDSIRGTGEQCDDGNKVDNDGCSSTCAQSEGFFCVPGKDCVAIVCGDGNRTPNEGCDDHNVNNNDGCNSACQVESGYRCSVSGCSGICGDGIVVSGEQCDDRNRVSGDGCNGLCQVEPYYTCDSSDPSKPSKCTSTIVCGDGEVQPGEICDPGIHASCYDTGTEACKKFHNDLVVDPVCGNGVIEDPEECDGDNGSGGCSDLCAVETGYACPKANYCYLIPVCGDGIVQPGEKCDAGATTTAGCVNCEVADDWYCSGSPSNCVPSVCGDGNKAPDEQCDDGDTDNGDGCSSACVVDAGYVCPPGLGRCITDCGNGRLDGNEDCDDGDTDDNDGCTQCREDVGFDCGDDGDNCVPVECGDGDVENGEGCDDGNEIAGDGCGATCQLEPSIEVGPEPMVDVLCGDGLKTIGEACDDGNLDDGDGCSSVCKIEDGWYCDDEVEFPESIQMKITYRDFMQRSRDGGHPHMKSTWESIPYYVTGEADRDIVGEVCTLDNAATCARLDDEGKPALNTTFTPATGYPVGIYGQGASPDTDSVTYNANAFKLWYRNSNDDNLYDINNSQPIKVDVDPEPFNSGDVIGPDTLTLQRQGATENDYVYVFESDGNLFYPLGTTRAADPPNDIYPVPMRGFGCTTTQSGGCGLWGTNNNEQRNFHFTSELRYFFQYQGGETLTFFGDDDVWVFVNGRLAVDIGGIHSTLYGRVVLGDDGANGAAVDDNCSVHGEANTPAICELDGPEKLDNDDARFNLVVGGVYEIVVFQAERNPTDSNYKLTLDGFIAPRSNCYTDCGDGKIAGTELCDEGDGVNVDGQYGKCNTECKFEYCGDGLEQSAYEACDLGALNVADPWYPTNQTTNCTSACERPAYCGDNILQSAYEVCDDGTNNNSYDGCAPGCQALGPYCGDGVKNGPEACDPADGVFVTYKADGTGCGADCQQAPYCGDLIRNGDEECDGDASTHCDENCRFMAYCGDGLKAASEACDYGEFNYDPDGEPVYGGCTLTCELGPRCGDGVKQEAQGEECDNGAANNDTLYGGCTTSCTLGPRCGDGIADAGEDCDNGYNEDTYKYVPDACGKGCKNVPVCGDGVVQSDFEWCDNGALNQDGLYNGCTTTCEWGPYCGDGTTDAGAGEACDDGADNTAYATAKNACGYDCQPAPYCGDGVRNGTEQCDNGTTGNVGGYNGCTADCKRGPYCGDNIRDAAAGEECDDGPVGSGSCSVDCKIRTWVE